MLPVQEKKREIVRLIESHQVVVLSSETGTGKTTQIPRFIQEHFGESVVCSQPRRIAAISIAKRVAEETGTELGEYVGYSVRFEERASEKTQIKYVTDGAFIRDFIDDALVKKYRAVVIDEVHERTINIDLLLGLVKDAVFARSDLKVVIMSATMCTDRFLEYFPGSVTYHIQSRTYPIELRYLPAPRDEYMDKIISVVLEINKTQPPGDILVFLTGEDEIEEACRRIGQTEKSKKSLAPYPLYASLPIYIQNKIFEKTDVRKVIFATNIAETSLTIESVVYVVDCGYAKQKVFDATMKAEMLLKLPISKSSADQRKGRAGRVRPGVCYRIYSEDAYQKMESFTIPEILRGELSSLVLKMARLEIKNLVTFDFIEPPLPDSVIVALNQLYFLGAVDEKGEITHEGRLLVEFPLLPKDAKTLVEGARRGVEEELVNMSALAGNIICRKEKFCMALETSDHFTYCRIMEEYERSKNRQGFCYTNGLNPQNMENALKAKKQLLLVIEKIRPQIGQKESAGTREERIELALLSGYLLQTAKIAGRVKADLAGTKARVVVRRLFNPRGRPRERGDRRIEETWVVYKELTKMDGKYLIRMVSNVWTPTVHKLVRQYRETLRDIKFSFDLEANAQDGLEAGR